MTFVLLLSALALIPATIASKKGRSALAWWVYGFLLFPVALIHALATDKKSNDPSAPKPKPGMEHILAVRQYLEPDEHMDVAIYGGLSFNRTVMAATDRRVICHIRDADGGYTMEVFPYGAISSVVENLSSSGYDITIHAEENVAEIKFVEDPEVREFLRVVRSRIGKQAVSLPPAGDGSPVAEVVSPEVEDDDPEVMDQLLKLGELRDKGILTEEEFADKKAKLLAKI